MNGALSETDIIRDTIGTLLFVGGQQAQQGESVFVCCVKFKLRRTQMNEICCSD